MSNDDRLDLLGAFDDDADGAHEAGLDPKDPPAPRRAIAKPRRRGWKIALAVLLALALVAGAAVGYYVWKVNHAVAKVTRVETFQPPATASRAPSASTTPGGLQPMTFVLLGSDARGDLNGRSDVLMVAYVTGDRKNVYLTSFPRDLWVPIPGHGEAKINAAYAFGGPALTMLTLEQLLGVRMEHSALIDFEGFIRLTDVLDGVQVTNKHESCDQGYCWPAGPITIRGAEALAYVRQRHGLPGGDLDRAERQRDVVKAVAMKAISGGVLSNPAKFSDVLDKMSDSIQVDATLTPDAMRNMATQMKISGGEAIGQLQAPFLGTSWSDDGQWIEVVDPAAMKELGDAMRTDKMQDYYARHKSDRPKWEQYGTKAPPPNAETPAVPVTSSKPQPTTRTTSAPTSAPVSSTTPAPKPTTSQPVSTRPTLTSGTPR